MSRCYLSTCNLVVMYAEKKNQLDATEWFIALIICSTCFGHLYTHRQELETMCVCVCVCVCYYRLWRAMPWSLVVGGQVQGRIASCPAPDLLPSATKALHTTSSNKTHIVSSS